MSSILKSIIKLPTTQFLGIITRTISNHKTTRHYADTPKIDSTSKQIVVHGSDTLMRFRVRRARPADLPRVLRFVRENAPQVWPGLHNTTPASNNNLLLADYVSRTLCQGHSMLAEQQEPKRGWSGIRGLALNTTVCPWDALVLENWAQCVRCPKFRKLMLFTAHCMRAPGLHDKYRVHNILQVMLMVPPNSPRATEIIQLLTKNSIQRGRDVGYTVLRFDVTSGIVNQVLNELKLTKEWESCYESQTDSLRLSENANVTQVDNRLETDSTMNKSVISVYTAFPQKETKKT